MGGFQNYSGSEFMPFLLPIIPAGAKLSAHTSLDQGKLGKIPGRQIGDGWAGFRQWQSFIADPQALEAWGRMYTEDKLPETIGLQAKELPACDVDVEDEQAAALVEVTAGIFLGRAPKRSRPNSCKFLLQYRLRPGAERIKKRRLVFRHPEHPDKGMAVEILGDGQQYLIEGKHPSGVLYQWDDGQGPLQWGYDSLTQIDKQAVDKFLGAIQEVLLANGYELVGGSAVPPKGDAAALSRPVGNAVPPRSSAPPEERYPVGPDHPDRAPSLELLAELLERCPCDAPQFASRDDWFHMLCAIKAACAGDDTFYRERVWPWCQAYPKNRENYVRNVWDSIYETSLGWSYLTGVAGDFGWSGWLSAYLTPIELDDETVGSDDTARPNSTRHAPVPKLMPADFALQKLPRRQFVLGNRFMAGVVTLGVGPPGAAKSTLSILTALSIASGERLTGEVVHCQGKVWIHNNEDSLDELYRRIGGILKYHGIDFMTVRENIFATSGLDEPLVVAIKEKDLVKRQQAVAEVIKSIKKKGIQHIAVDPFVSTHRGVSENSNEEIEQVVDCFRAVAHETGCSIDLIHHSLKPQNKSSEALAGDMNAARGASSLAGAVRMLYTVLPMGKKTAEDMNVPGDLAARLVRLDHAKGNYSPRDTRIKWFELESYNIGNSSDPGDDFFLEGDTIAVPKMWEPPIDTRNQEKPKKDREAERRDRLQEVRDFVAGAMPSDRSKLTDILRLVEQRFGYGQSAARMLLKEAIPEGEGTTAKAGAHAYSLRAERKGRSAPHPIVIVRKLIGGDADEDG